VTCGPVPRASASSGLDDEPLMQDRGAAVHPITSQSTAVSICVFRQLNHGDTRVDLISPVFPVPPGVDFA
jgi:hypothetical protein